MNPLTTQRDLPAAPAAVFDCIRDPARLARWWGPDGFTNRFERFEFAPGGAWDFEMIGPDGHVYPNRAQFAAVEPCQGRGEVPLFLLDEANVVERGRDTAMGHARASLWPHRLGLRAQGPGRASPRKAALLRPASWPLNS